TWTSLRKRPSVLTSVSVWAPTGSSTLRSGVVPGRRRPSTRTDALGQALQLRKPTLPSPAPGAAAAASRRAVRAAAARPRQPPAAPAATTGRAPAPRRRPPTATPTGAARGDGGGAAARTDRRPSRPASAPR